MPIESGDSRSSDKRFSMLETSIARLSATVEGIVHEWDKERGDLHAAITDLRASSQTRMRDAAPWIGLLFVMAGMAATLVVREISHIEVSQELAKESTDYRMERNEGIFRPDHDEIVKSAERWRLWQSGHLVTPPPANIVKVVPVQGSGD